MPISVVHVDNNNAMLLGMEIALADHDDIQLVANVSVPVDMRPLLEQHQPDVVFFSPPEHPRVPTPNFDLMETIRLFQELGTAVVVFSDNYYYDEAAVPEIVNSGVRGYIMKNDGVLNRMLPEIIRKIHQDKTYRCYSPKIQELMAEA